MTITTIKVTREDVAQARRARLERAGVTVHVSPWLLERARTRARSAAARAAAPPSPAGCRSRPAT
jgi:hypothetical protein